MAWTVREKQLPIQSEICISAPGSQLAFTTGQLHCDLPHRSRECLQVAAGGGVPLGMTSRGTDDILVLTSVNAQVLNRVNLSKPVLTEAKKRSFFPFRTPYPDGGYFEKDDV